MIVDTGLKTFEYLDVKLDLNNGMMEAYKKRNCELRYANVKSNHPRHIFEKIPVGIEYRLSQLIFCAYFSKIENMITS